MRHMRTTGQNRERKLKFSYKEKQEYETIEQDILDLEDKLESLDAEMAANATNSKRLSELAAEREQTEADLEHKMGALGISGRTCGKDSRARLMNQTGFISVEKTPTSASGE